MYDLFISYATEDGDDFVKPLVKALNSKGLKVWYDELELKLGDSIYEKINEGLNNCLYAVVVLSPSTQSI